MADIVITWPKTQPLESYLRECYKAVRDHKSINFRVPTMPGNIISGDKCYVVHSGFVRCYHIITGVGHRGDGHVFDPHTGEFLPAGIYIVRDPEPHMMTEVKRMGGFQGWRYWR